MKEVAGFARELPSVVEARDYEHTCSDLAQALIREDIEKLGLNRVVVASCSPTLHEHTFQRACQDAGLNPYLFEMINIGEHCSWVTEDKQIATEKAKALVSAAVRRVYYHEPLEIREVPFKAVESFTVPLVGDVSLTEAKSIWPDKILFVNCSPHLVWGEPEEVRKGYETIRMLDNQYRI